MVRKNNVLVSIQAITIFLILTSTLHRVNSFDVTSFLSLLNGTKTGTVIQERTPFSIENARAIDSHGENRRYARTHASRPSLFPGRIVDIAKALYDLTVLNFSITIIHNHHHQPTDGSADSILAVTIITIASTIIYTVVLNPSKIIGNFAKAGKPRFALYITFIVMAFVSLVLGFFLLLVSTKKAQNDQLMRIIKELLAQASMASIVLCMAIGLCAVLPKIACIAVGAVCVMAGCFAGNSDLGLYFGGSKNCQILDPT